MKKAFSKKQITAMALFGVSVLAIAGFGSYVTYSIFETQKDQDGSFPGTIGLRSYFQKGTGTETDPFVISRPLHFYNLTRLQNLGIFTGKSYFSLGYDPDHPDDPYAANSATDLKFYPDNSTAETADMIAYLDMSDMSTNYTFLSVGNEGSPFYGTFNGNYKTVKGLKIHSEPEDVGVFGYTYNGSMITNVCFEDLDIYDDGYSTLVTGLSTLYDSSYSSIKTAGADLVFNADSAVSLSNTPTALCTYTKETADDARLRSFTFTLPDLSGSVSDVYYDFRSSSEYVTVTNNNDGTYSANIKRGDTVDCIESNTDFFAASGNKLNSRLSLVGTLYQDGIAYSKTLITYKLSFVSSVVSSTQHDVIVNGAIDYVNTVASGETGYVTGASEYAHGVNIGYLIGHCDGSVSSCYVHDGSLHMNTVTENTVNVAQETETGLIGEVGVTLANEFTPAISYGTSGDIGVVNFSKMYSEIAGSTSFSSWSPDGSHTYYLYTPDYPSGGAISDNKYSKYLRTDGSTANSGWGKAVTNAQNSIDFGGQKLIEDETGINRNLGVFKLMTSNHDTTSSPANQYSNGIGEFNIKKQDSGYTEFYYTTAEFVDTTGTIDPTAKWGYGSSYEKRIHIGSHLPYYGDESTWNSDMETYWNYIIRCSLAEDTPSNYFYNTGSKFLKSYFSNKLVGKEGASVLPGSKDFGVLVKNVDLETNTISNITNLDSSLKVNETKDTASVTQDSVKYPYNSINFSIESDYGGNVTILAASDQYTSSYVSIYDKALYFNGATEPSYTMYLPYTTDVDSFAYFDYAYGTGAVGTTGGDGVIDDGICNRASSGSKLFAHTFFLPKGKYFIGCPETNKYAKVYYVAVQGQEGKGNLGDNPDAFSETNVIENIDFVYSRPTAAQFIAKTGDWRCYLSFACKFSSSTGNINVETGLGYPVITRPTSDNLTYALIFNQKGGKMIFNDTDYTNIHYVEYQV